MLVMTAHVDSVALTASGVGDKLHETLNEGFTTKNFGQLTGTRYTGCLFSDDWEKGTFFVL